MTAGAMSWEEFLQLKKHEAIYKFNVVTGSMAPLIAVGDIVIVEITEKVELHDIVVFWQEGQLICHALWHRNQIIHDRGNPVWVTRALVGELWDLSIHPNQVLGKVVNHRLSWWWVLRLRWRDVTRTSRK